MQINTSLLSDTILVELEKYHPRVYRNNPPSNPVFPYVIYVLDSTLDTSPSEDFYIHVDIYEDKNKSTRMIDTLADSIDNNINNKVINTTDINIHMIRENRQFEDNESLETKKLITMRYNTRVYFK